MSHELKGLYKFGGAAFVISGVLFLSREFLELMAGPPPSSGVEILAWVESGKLALSLVSEVLFFAAMALVPAVSALYHSLASTDRAKAVTGCGIIATAIPVIAMLLVVHGHLVYPVYGIRVSSPAVAENIIAVFYGGIHAVDLMLGIATIVLSVALMRGVYGKGIAYLGFITGVFDIIGAYPYAIGPILTLVCQVFFAAWFVAVGSKLYRMGSLIELHPYPHERARLHEEGTRRDGHHDNPDYSAHGSLVGPDGWYPRHHRCRRVVTICRSTERSPGASPSGQPGVVLAIRAN